MLKRMTRSKHSASKELQTQDLPAGPQEENIPANHAVRSAASCDAHLAPSGAPTPKSTRPCCSNVSGPFANRAAIFTRDCCFMHQESRKSPAFARAHARSDSVLRWLCSSAERNSKRKLASRSWSAGSASSAVIARLLARFHFFSPSAT